VKKKMTIGQIALASLSVAGAVAAAFWAARNPEKAKKALNTATDAMRTAGTTVADAAVAVPAAIAAAIPKKLNGAGEHRADA
jgi:hypothetical protein